MTYNLECPVTGYKDTDVVTMAHGSGGESMQRLIKEMFAKAFPDLQSDNDAAVIGVFLENIVISTDSFVVNPIFFPGGDIGSLSVHGTVNDITMMGGIPQWMTAAFILEEGFPMKDLERIVFSIAEASKKARVRIVTGDTKVVECSHTKIVKDEETRETKTVPNPGIYINTTGIGYSKLESWEIPKPEDVAVGNKIIISGDIGRHGMAIMSVRNGLELDPPILSDSAPLNFMVRELLHKVRPLCMRDATRGGVGAVLNEIARSAKLHLRIDEEKVPVDKNVRGLAEILGLDPLNIANEGRFVLFVKPQDAEKSVEILHQFEGGEKAAIIGEVVAEHKRGLVTAKTLLGSEKVIHMPAGELLPRIC